MTLEHPDKLLTDLAEAGNVLARLPGCGEHAQAVRQARDLIPKLNLALEAVTNLAEKAATPAIIPKMVWRCHVTGNPVGTDAVMVGYACQCQGCRASRTIEALSAQLAEAERNYNHECNCHDLTRKRTFAAEAKVQELTKALTEISSPTQTLNLLWWQERARAALTAIAVNPGGAG